MTFYQTISDYYRKIFPLNPAQVKFVKNTLAETCQLSLLDIGCGTGDLSLELSKSFKKVVGIDLDEAMLDQARSKSAEDGNVEFINLNMMDIGQHFGNDAFNSIVCFGNTLVHLNTPDSISGFINQCKRVLTQDGKLLLQIINYDRILDLKISSLPTLENNDIRFVRNYQYLEGMHLIDFETILTVKSTNQVIKSNIRLYPLRKAEIESLIKEAGFRSFQVYSNFNWAPLAAESIPLVIEADN
ncbi:MAG: class I SAM-dependent methyltransferase [Bacteroidales bacterium]|nr:class I SAM-dependent methyltransferase [Bacteroidales bacterium]